MSESIISIEKYDGYFHDGIVFEIEYIDNDIIFYLESCGLYPEDNLDNIPLSSRGTISGKLHLKEIKSVRVNGKKQREKIKKIYDEGDIYTLEIKANKLLLQVSWEDYSVQPTNETDVFTIEIIAKEIVWENIPNLFDASWEEENG